MGFFSLCSGGLREPNRQAWCITAWTTCASAGPAWATVTPWRMLLWRRSSIGRKALLAHKGRGRGGIAAEGSSATSFASETAGSSYAGVEGLQV